MANDKKEQEERKKDESVIDSKLFEHLLGIIEETRPTEEKQN